MNSLFDMQDMFKQLQTDIAKQLTMPELTTPSISMDAYRKRDYSADLLDLAEKGLASNICRQLIRQLNEFNTALDPEHEVGICVIGVAGQGITFRPTDLEAWDPSLIIILGQSTQDGKPIQVVQHVSQLSVAFVTVPRIDPAQPKRPIGFHAADRTAEETQR